MGGSCLLLTGSSDTTVVLWTVAPLAGARAGAHAPTPLRALRGHVQAVTAVGLSMELGLAASGAADGTVLLRLEPVTGRAQQLRIHCAHVGMPLLGDTLHGTPEAAAAASRLCLHASELAFAHPEHGGEVAFVRDEEFLSEGGALDRERP